MNNCFYENSAKSGDICGALPIYTQESGNDYYHNLSLAGLQSCQFFQNEIGSFEIIDGEPTIKNTVNQTLMQSYNQYNFVGQQNIRP